MSQIRFFKKWDPRVKLLLSHGGWHSFPAFGDWGLEKTSDPFLIREFESAIAGQRGGISEITEGEFNELKKKPILSKPYNEALSNNEYIQTAKKWRENVVPAGAEVLHGIVDASNQIGAKLVRAVTQNIDNWRPASVKR